MTQEVLDQLTDRQRQLLELVAAGTTASKALARETGLAPSTIDVFLSKTLKILDRPDRVSAAQRYVEMRDSSIQGSISRPEPLPKSSETGLPRVAATIGLVLKGAADFLRGPPLGGKEQLLGWDHITLQILRVAVVGVVAISVVVLIVLGLFRTFS